MHDTSTTDPVQAVKAAGLRYVTDEKPGIRRRRDGDHFIYIGVDGRPIDDEKTLQRIKSLAIPPAYEEVWICPSPNGYLQATGRDAKGRKQYRYHPRWREVRDETKYERMLAFGEALPHIRARVTHDLHLPGLPREKVLATIVRLLETTCIRVGNEEYAKTNKSFGLTTLRNRHVKIEGSTLHFHFRGKSGKVHSIDLRDRKLAQIVKRLRDLPGQELFEYKDESGELRTVDSNDVNAYLHEIAGEEFTAKDFRTWAGTVLTALALCGYEKYESETQAKKNVVQAIKTVAQHLGNTPTICRKSYVHPEVIAAYMDGMMAETLQQRVAEEVAGNDHVLDRDESSVMQLLRQRLASPSVAPP